MKWLRDNIKYPSICQEQGVQGRVTVSFVVNRDGSIVDVNVVRSPDEHLSQEAMRVVKLMPKWKPARQGNKTVRSRFMLPVLFRLG
jgi:protein TonB